MFPIVYFEKGTSVRATEMMNFGFGVTPKIVGYPTVRSLISRDASARENYEKRVELCQ